MFPIRDHNPSERTPYVTLGLIFFNIVLFVMTSSDPSLGYQLALFPRAVMNGADYTGLVTHMFIHAGFMHLAGNMLFLWVFGDNLEDQMGHGPFLIFYLACGLAAAAGQIASDPMTRIPMVGASGAIAGVMGGYLLLFPRARVDVLAIIVILVRIFTVPAWLVLAVWFGLQLLLGGIGQEDGVAYWAHSGGFIAGVLLAVPVFLRRGGPAFWRLTHGQPPHDPIDYRQSRIPEVRR